LKPLNILLADDAKSVGQSVSEYLRSTGHQVTYVESGEAAVTAFKTQAFDLVLMDVVMPGIGGLEAVKQIKAIPTTIWGTSGSPKRPRQTESFLSVWFATLPSGYAPTS